MAKKKKITPTNIPQDKIDRIILVFIEKYIDWLTLFSVILFSYFIWLPTKNLPYHWDSAGFIIVAARNLLNTNFHPFVAAFSDFAHPPLFVASLALIWKIFGNNFLNSHILMFPFLPILMFCTYLIGRKLNDLSLGITSAFLVGSIPFVISEYGQIYIDLPMAALVTLSITAFFYKNNWLAAIFLSLAVLTKMPAFILFPIYLFVTFIQNKNLKNWKAYIPFALPLMTLCIWLAYHYSVTGWLLSIPGRHNSIPKTPDQFLRSSIFVSKAFFINQSRFLLTILGIGSAIYLKLKNKLDFNNPLLILLIITNFLGVLFFIILGEFGSRYGIFLLPAFVLSFLYFWQKTINNNWIFGGTSGVICLMFIFSWHPKISSTQNYEFLPSDNLSYQDIITIGQYASKFLEINYSSAKIYGAFPEVYQLTQPFQGYVDKPLNFNFCNNFKVDARLNQIIYIHPYSPTQMACRQILDKVSVSPINHFEFNGKWVELYLVDATKSAQLKDEPDYSNSPSNTKTGSSSAKL